MSVRARVVAALLNRHTHNCTHQEGPTMPSNPPSSPVGAMDASARPIPPEDPIETDWCAHTTLARRYRDERDDLRIELADAHAENTRNSLAWAAENHRLTTDVIAIDEHVQTLRAALTRAHDTLAERDATIARMRTGRP